MKGMHIGKELVSVEGKNVIKEAGAKPHVITVAAPENF